MSSSLRLGECGRRRDGKNAYWGCTKIDLSAVEHGWRRASRDPVSHPELFVTEIVKDKGSRCLPFGHTDGSC